MTKTTDLTRWYFSVNWHVPVSSPVDGTINWELNSRDCDILLPSDVENPAEYIRMSGRDDCMDIISYEDFSTTAD